MTTSNTQQMKATKLDSDRNATIIDTDVREPAEKEVQVKVISSAVDTAIGQVLSNSFMSSMIHVIKDPLILGWHFSGTVTKTGADVTAFKEGDNVFGHLQYDSKTDQGSFSEYISVSETDLAHKPESVTFDVAAASATESTTALQALRDLGGLKSGKTVLINGAGGGVGSVAVQVAKNLGANVTAICSTKDVERVKSLGADTVINRTVEKDPLQPSDHETVPKYDVIFDIPAVFPMRALRSLNEQGVYVVPLFNRTLVLGYVTTLFSKKKTQIVVCQSKKDDLERIGKWIEEGKLKIEIDSQYKIANLEDALKRQDERNKVGRVVINVENGWD